MWGLGIVEEHLLGLEGDLILWVLREFGELLIEKVRWLLGGRLLLRRGWSAGRCIFGV
jgi:hypothetical protein